MIFFKFKTPLSCRITGLVEDDQDAPLVTVERLTVKDIIIETILKRVSVRFFEGYRPFVLFADKEYDKWAPMTPTGGQNFSLSFNGIEDKINKIINDDPISLLDVIFRYMHPEEIHQQEVLVYTKIIEYREPGFDDLAVMEESLTASEDDSEDESEDDLECSDSDRIVTEKIKNNRLAICKGCSYFDADANAGTGECKKCNCPIPYKIKLSKSSCPISKWDSIKIK